MDSFEVQDMLFNKFTSDTELMQFLNATDTNNYDLLNKKVQREILAPETIKPEDAPFIYIICVNAYVTNNWMRNNAIMEIGAYTGSRYDAINIIRACHRLLRTYDGYSIIHEGQVSSGVSGIYKYAIRFSPLINS